MLIRSRAPLRLGLAGGGTDVSPYCDQFGGAVLNVTVDRYAYSVIRMSSEPVIRLVATDRRESLEFACLEDIQLNGALDLHKAVYLHIIKKYNQGNPLYLELSTFCDAPPGSGLGSSSTIVVSMVKAFAELLNLPLDDYSIAQSAFEIERIDCGLAGGRQDQYSATFGGFNFMEFYANERAVINPLRIKDWIICELEASLLLYYCGLSRESANIINDQTANIKKGTDDALGAFHGIKKEAILMKESLLKGDFDGIVDSFRKGWEAKKSSARSVSSPFIDQILNAALAAGAQAGKVSGAGGGGFIMFFVPPDKRMDVIRSLEQFDGQISNAHFTKNGTQAWRIL